MREAKTKQARAGRSAGFTLIELLVAVAILGILGTVAIREIWEFIDEAKQTATKTKVDAIYDQVKAFKRKHNRLPQDLIELTEPDDLKNGEPWLDRDDLLDAWGREVEMQILDDRTGKFRIISFGENGEEDGFDTVEFGFSADISSDQRLGGSTEE